MFRHHEEPTDPFIPYRDMSETALPAGMSMQDMLEGEPRWANNQVRVVRGILQELRFLAECVLLRDGDVADGTRAAGASTP